jgi:hypothetical protein
MSDIWQKKAESHDEKLMFYLNQYLKFQLFAYWRLFTYDLNSICLLTVQYNIFDHIFFCNTFVFACSIIARSQCWLYALRVNIRICPQISVFAPEFNFRYLRSGLKDYMSKYKERWCIKICIKLYFNQINTVQNIGIKFK